MKHTILILAVMAVTACGTVGTALAPVLDPQGIADAAGVTSTCVQAQSAVIAPAFEVDWSGGAVTYGGGVFLGCDSELFQFHCTQEKPVNPGDKPVWKCEPLGSWVKQ